MGFQEWWSDGLRFPEITDQHVFGVKWNLVATRTHSAHTVQYDLWVWPTHIVWGLFCSLFITQKTKIPPEKIITLACETAGSCWHVKFNLWCYNVPYWNNRGRNVTSTFLPVSIFFPKVSKELQKSELKRLLGWFGWLLLAFILGWWQLWYWKALCQYVYGEIIICSQDCEPCY